MAPVRLLIWIVEGLAVLIIMRAFEQEVGRPPKKGARPMGTFRVTVVAAGNHGCERDQHRLAPHQDVQGCGYPGCTDCITRRYVEELKASSASIQEATIHHWPGQHGEVVDNLITKKRIGQF